MATRDSIFRNAVSKIPKTAFEFHISLEGFTVLRKAIISMAAVYCHKKTLTKISKGKFAQSRVQEITGAGLWLSSSSGVMQTVAITSNSGWQYLWSIPSQGSSHKP